MTVAALYVDRRGPYFGRDDVDPWDAESDARLYEGPHPVVAHPPCGPWGRLALFSGGMNKLLGPIAVEQVRFYGGVLEHPRDSGLWSYCDLPQPGGLFDDKHGGWSLELAQVDWGHVARKKTWLYFVRVPRAACSFPDHREPTHWVRGSRRRNSEKMTSGLVPPGIKVCSAQQRRRTPPRFADWLIALAH